MDISIADVIIKQINDVQCIICLEEKDDNFNCDGCGKNICHDCNFKLIDHHHKIDGFSLTKSDKLLFQFDKKIACPNCRRLHNSGFAFVAN